MRPELRTVLIGLALAALALAVVLVLSPY